MPLTAGGRLKIIASANLGALGARDGSPVEYNWVLPSVAPLLLPWLAILALLTLKPNRCAAAWLIWLPLGAVMTLSFLPSALPGGLNSLLDAIAALAFGVAGVWLLANYLGRAHRLLTFLCVLLAMAAGGALTAVARQGTSWNMEMLQVGIIAGLGVLASSLALSVCGWVCCRRRFRPWAIYPCLLAALVVAWVLMAAPFFILAVVASGSQIPWSEFLVPVLCVAAGNFALLLPFLLLSSINPFFRERLQALLNVTPGAPVISPTDKPV